MGAAGAAEAVRTVLDRRLGQLQELTGLPMVFGGPIERIGSAERLVIEALRGNLSPAMQGLAVPRGQGLGGLALARSQPFVVNDYRSNRVITHHFDQPVVALERLTAIFAFPVRVRGRVEAVLYGASRDERPIGDVALRTAGGVVSSFGLEVARLLAEDRPSPPALSSAQALAELEAIAGRLVDPALRARLLQAHRSLTATAEPPRSKQLGISLAPREEQCLALVAVGATNAQIAEELKLGVETVKAYLGSAMRKLKVTNRTGAVHAARSSGLI